MQKEILSSSGGWAPSHEEGMTRVSLTWAFSQRLEAGDFCPISLSHLVRVRERAKENEGKSKGGNFGSGA
ncbi:unnamed protein product [Prunus armeniaca]